MENQGVGDAGMGFWKRKLQQILLLAVAVDFTVVFMLLSGGLLHFIPKETSRVCLTPTCVQEVKRITNQISSEVNPCEDLYGFVCGNYQRNFDPITVMEKEAKRQMIELYFEPSKIDEHPMVTAMKNLFIACINEHSPHTNILNTEQIKKALRMAGGWPLLEGSNWDETKFDWLQATYNFRELGYHYKVFLNLSVIEDRRTKNKHILEVSLPTPEMIRKDFITELAVVFGANETYASSEVNETYNYMLQLFYESTKINSQWKDNRGTFSSLSTYQQKQPTINWLEFINKIIAPAARISHKDVVLFPDQEQITMWLNALSKIPKRIQANYMMAKVIEEIVSDIKLDEQHEQQISNYWKYSTVGCLEKIQNRFRFFPNPIDMLYIRRYIPMNKLKMIEDLVNNVEVTFLELLMKAKWLAVKDKNSIINTIRNITNDVIIGAPKIYFQDKILDEMAVDLENVDNYNYLQILLQVNKNYQSLLYKQIYSSIDERKYLFWNLLRATEESLHYYTNNEITLPATILQGPFFNENRPNYLNYGSLGSFVAAEYANQLINTILIEKPTSWSYETQKGFLKIRRCFLQQVMDNLKISGVMAQWDYEMLYQSLSTHVSYSAYQMWEKSNGVEPKVASSAYSNNQLFWISAASFYCQHLHSLPKIFNINKQYSFYVSGIGINNDNFAKDFHCPVKSKMNPLKKCYVF